MQCIATVRKTGRQCQRRAVTGYRVCQVHGGATPRGIASPHYKTGKYSKVLPKRLAARYHAAIDDPALLELREDIGLLDARLADLLSRVDTGESGALWRSLLEARIDLLAAKRADDKLGQVEAINRMVDLIGQGHADYRAWAEVGSVLEQRRRLVESERKRTIEMQQTMTSEQAMLLMGALLQAVKANVADRAALSAIQNEFIRLTNARDVSTDEE